jgi:hypothetical protein
MTGRQSSCVQGDECKLAIFHELQQQILLMVALQLSVVLNQGIQIWGKKMMQGSLME